MLAPLLNERTGQGPGGASPHGCAAGCGRHPFESLPFDAEAARAFGQVAASLREVGRKPAARSCDAMIAAIALANDLPLYTTNAADFAGIDGLVVVAVSV